MQVFSVAFPPMHVSCGAFPVWAALSSRSAPPPIKHLEGLTFTGAWYESGPEFLILVPVEEWAENYVLSWSAELALCTHLPVACQCCEFR